MNATIELLRAIGSPFGAEREMPRGEGELAELYAYAVKNKIPLLYLEVLKEKGVLGQLEPNYEEWHARQLGIIKGVTRVSRLLNATNIDYVVFKTLRPYPAAPNDIDILCLGDDNDFRRTAEIMLQAGYQRPVSDKAIIGPRTILLQDTEVGIIIDLAKEVGLNYIIYFDKQRLNNHRIKTKLLNEDSIKTITPQADLVIMAARCAIPEQIYRLEDYYITFYSLAGMNMAEVDNFIDLVNGNHLTLAAKTYLSIGATLHQVAHGMVPPALERIITRLGGENFETRRVVKSGFKMPHRFSLLTPARAFLEKAKEGKTRKSIIKQLISLPAEPGNTATLIKEALRSRLLV